MSDKRLGVIGWPVAHSLGPAMFHAAFAALGLDGWRYDLLPVPPDIVGHSLRTLRDEGGYLGVNVTVPLKTAVLAHTRPDALARALGAANTIDFRSGAATNTDVGGFIEDLHAHGVPVAGSRALVIGAGGAARAVIYALHTQGWRVAAAARRVEQAQALAANFSAAAAGGAQSVSALPLERSSLAGLAPGLIVNASSAGMFPAVETTPWLPGLPFPPGAFVYDLVYNPSQTALMSAARGAGLRACNGLGMLVEQAALALETWLGCIAPRNAMRAAISRAAEDRPPDSSTPTGGAQWK